jgi:hypothetical protein
MRECVACSVEPQARTGGLRGEDVCVSLLEILLDVREEGERDLERGKWRR